MLMNDMQQLFNEDIRTIGALLGASADALAGKTVLITGGGGFLGRYLVATLVALNRERAIADPREAIALIETSFAKSPAAQILAEIKFRARDIGNREMRKLDVVRDKPRLHLDRPEEHGARRAAEQREVVLRERVGRQRIYQLRPRPLQEVFEWVEFFEEFWSMKLSALGKYLDEKHRK